MNKLKSTLLIAAWLIASLAMAQDGVSIGNWRTHLPYQKVIGVQPVGKKIYAATQYELFYYVSSYTGKEALTTELSCPSMCHNSSAI